MTAALSIIGVALLASLWKVAALHARVAACRKALESLQQDAQFMKRLKDEGMLARRDLVIGRTMKYSHVSSMVPLSARGMEWFLKQPALRPTAEGVWHNTGHVSCDLLQHIAEELECDALDAGLSIHRVSPY